MMVNPIKINQIIDGSPQNDLFGAIDAGLLSFVVYIRAINVTDFW
jgi:hypothetical protein